jgi:hypothetical protein
LLSLSRSICLCVYAFLSLLFKFDLYVCQYREKSWKKSFTLPTAVLNHTHLNFVKRYHDIGRKISGFTKTKWDPKTASAFKISWSRLGTGVEVLWKQAVVEKDWLGESHQPDSPGFLMLPELPRGRPEVVEPIHRIMLKKYISELTGAGIRRALVPHLGEADADSSIEWLRQSAQGYIPFSYENPDDEKTCVPKSAWGPKVTVGIEGREGNFFLMRDDIDRTDDANGAKFWALPLDIQDCLDQSISDAISARRRLQGLPNIRYSDVSPAVARADQKEAADDAEEEEQDDGHADVQHADDAEEEDESKDVSASSSRRIVPASDEQKEKQYGASFDNCKKGSFALVHTEFEEGQGGIGIDLYKVQDPVPNGSPPSFWGTQYCPSKVGITVTDEQCLSEKWHMKSTARVLVLAWQVVVYFKNLTSAKKIPNAAKTQLTQAETVHDLVLFVAPPPERVFPTTYVDDAEQYDNESKNNLSDDDEDDGDE